MQNLGTLSGNDYSAAYGINKYGQVVGHAYGTGNQRVFLWENGTMIDLNTLISTNSGLTITSAQGINDFGQIVGYGIYNGQEHAFLLTPTPEPASLALFLVAILGIAIRKFWRK